MRHVRPAAVQSGADSQAAKAVACPCYPGGVSHSRRQRRYPSDMSDSEWPVCEPMLPHPAWQAGKGGRPSG